MSGVQLGERIPDVTLPAAPTGAPVTVAPGASGATVVVFTCNHCPYALAWHDRIQQVARDYQSWEVQFVQINSNDTVKYPADSFDRMADRVNAGELASDYLFDESQKVAALFGAKVTPDVFVFDQAGYLAYRGAPDENYADEALQAAWLRSALDDVLAGRAPGLPETTPYGCSIKWRP